MGEWRKQMGGGGTQKFPLIKLQTFIYLPPECQRDRYIHLHIAPPGLSPINIFLVCHLNNFSRLIQIVTHFICVLQTLPYAFYLHCCSIINPLKLVKTMSKQKFSLLSPTSQRGLTISEPVLCNFKATSLILPGNNSFRAEIFTRVQTSSLSENATNNPRKTLWVFSWGWDRLFFLMALSCIL